MELTVADGWAVRCVRTGWPSWPEMSLVCLGGDVELITVIHEIGNHRGGGARNAYLELKKKHNYLNIKQVE